MPKKQIKKEAFSKSEFEKTLKVSKTTKKALTDKNKGLVLCNERTIRRACDEGKIRKEYLLQIAEALNVDPNLLTGEIRKEESNRITDYYRLAFEKDELSTEQKKYIEKKINERCDPRKHPFSNYQKRKDRDEAFSKGSSIVNENLKKYLSIFDIDSHQYDDLLDDEKWQLQKDLYDASFSVLKKYFSQTCTNRDLFDSYLELSIELDNYYEETLPEKTYLENLRSQWLKNPPNGYTRSKIKKMSLDELDSLDYLLQQLEWADSSLRKEYCEHPPKGYSPLVISNMPAEQLLELERENDPFKEKYFHLTKR